MTTLFFDRTFGKRLPDALRLLGIDVEAHQDHFRPDAPDDEWLAAVSERGWIVLTNDKRNRFNEAERQALIAHGVSCFVFTSGSRTRTALPGSPRRPPGLLRPPRLGLRRERPPICRAPRAWQGLSPSF